MRTVSSFRAILVALVALFALSSAMPAGTADARSAARSTRAQKPYPHRVVPYRPGSHFTADTDLVSDSGYAAWMIDEVLARATPLPRLGSAFMAAERTEGINARYLLAHAILETRWGTSDIARFKRNLFGYDAYDRNPWSFASRFATYQQGIAAVAAKIRANYLTPGGRFWLGFPTLRAMNVYYASALHWADSIAALANEIDGMVVTLRERGLTFRTPALRGSPTVGAKLSLDVPWRARAGAVLPAAIRFAVRWTPIALVEGASTGPSTVPPTTWTMAGRTNRSGHVVRLALRAPAVPGAWRLDVEARDSDGRPLPSTDRPSIRSLVVRVSAPLEAGVDLAIGRDGRPVATVVNRGRLPIAAAGPTGLAATLEVWALPLDPAIPAGRLAISPLRAQLAPGARLSVAFSAPKVPAVVVARLSGDPAAVGRTWPVAALVTPGPAGRTGPPALTRLAVASPRDDALLLRAATAAGVRLVTANDTGTVGAVVAQTGGNPALEPALAAVEGTPGAPSLLVRSLAAEPALDGGASSALVSLASAGAGTGASAGASAGETAGAVGGAGSSAGTLFLVSGLPGGLRLVVAAIVPPDGGSADAATLSLAWIPIASAPTADATAH